MSNNLSTNPNVGTSKPIANSFPKANRLLTPAQFKAVFDGAVFKSHQPHLMAFVTNNEQPQARLGLAITKKKVPTAVARNRLKRLIRECFRHQHKDLPCVDIVFIVKRPIQKISNDQLVGEIEGILHRIVKKSHIK